MRIKAVQARLALTRGDSRAAEHWARAYADRVSADDVTEVLVLARVQVATSRGRSAELEQSVARLEGLRASALADKRVGNLIEMLIVLALAQQVRREPQQANNVLCEALELAASEGYCRVFLDEGPPVIALLERCARAIASGGRAGAADF